MEALRALLDPALFLPSLIASLLAALLCGTTGPLVVSRRLVFLSGAVAHVAVGGIGAALYARHHFDWQWCDPLAGALVAAVLGAVVLSAVRHFWNERQDTAIGALWAVGMATGLILVKLTPGYHTELMSYLFGYLAAADWGDVQLLAILVAVQIVVLACTYKRLVAVGLDPQAVRLQGISVWMTDVLLLIMVALTVVALTRVVGLILVIALLTLPAAAAARHFRRMGSIMAVSTLLCLLLVSVPRVLVYGTPIAPEPAIVIAAAVVYAAGLLMRRRR